MKFQFQHLVIVNQKMFIIGKNFTEHLDNLREVFDTFRITNLKLKPGKCSLEVVYLGYVVSTVGISADPQKVELVNNFHSHTIPHHMTTVAYQICLNHC